MIKKIQVKLFLSFFVLVLVPIVAKGATLEVDKNDASCSTTSHPYCTVTEAISAATAEDSITVASGTYQENIVIDKNLTITGASQDATILDGSLATNKSIVTVNAEKTVLLSGLSVVNGTSSGIINFGHLTLDHVTVRDNIVGTVLSPLCELEGGGICSEIGSALVIRDSLITNNSANYDGGGIASKGSLTIEDSQITHNYVEGVGGGIMQANATAILNRVLLTGNTAESDLGGAIFLINSHLDLTNSTVSDNSACLGGGIVYQGDANILDLTFVTIANNISTHAWAGASGLSSSDGGDVGSTINMTASIFYNNTLMDASVKDCAGATITSGGYNIIGASTGCPITTTTGDLLDTDPLLVDLATIGSTMTYALQSTSPAFDAIPSTESFCAGTDQAGTLRPQNGKCDIGAHENLGTPPASTVVAVCGNNITETGEACDDGNLIDGDGCSSICTVETSDPADPENPVLPAECGNNIIETGETCDDGNTTSDDGCDSTCQIEEGGSGSGGTNNSSGGGGGGCSLVKTTQAANPVSLIMVTFFVFVVLSVRKKRQTTI